MINSCPPFSISIQFKGIGLQGFHFLPAANENAHLLQFFRHLLLAVHSPIFWIIKLLIDADHAADRASLRTFSLHLIGHFNFVRLCQCCVLMFSATHWNLLGSVNTEDSVQETGHFIPRRAGKKYFSYWAFTTTTALVCIQSPASFLWKTTDCLWLWRLSRGDCQCSSTCSNIDFFFLAQGMLQCSAVGCSGLTL